MTVNFAEDLVGRLKMSLNAVIFLAVQVTMSLGPVLDAHNFELIKIILIINMKINTFLNKKILLDSVCERLTGTFGSNIAHSMWKS